jgi:hypothetical protein
LCFCFFPGNISCINDEVLCVFSPMNLAFVILIHRPQALNLKGSEIATFSSSHSLVVKWCDHHGK